MAQPQPIIHSPFQDDHPMPSPSYSSTHNGSFNPASYTRAFFASGSFGNRHFPGSSPSQFLNPLDPAAGKMSSSIESDRGSIINALSAIEREEELCRNYTCCGLNLQDLHALVEHFEESHVVVVDPCSQAVPSQLYPNNYQSPVPNTKFDQYQGPRPHPQHQLAHQHHHLQHHQRQQGSFDPADDMELDVDSSPASSSASSPPLTPITTPLVPYSTQRAFAATTSFTPLSLSQPPSACPSPVSAFDTTTVLPSRPLTSTIAAALSSAQDSFSPYSPYSDYNPIPSPLQASHEAASGSSSQPGSPYSCVPPTLLYSSSSTTPANTPSSSRVASPSQASYHPLSAQASTSASGSSSTASSPTSTPRASTTLSRPASSLLLSKPFRCPKANCNKSYKQANGLKYHMTHGSCNFAPPKDLEALQALLAEKGVVVNGNDRSGVQITEGELREVEREAERRLRPFACGVGDCQRRYKNMNGLRYHYQHSGDHGAIGLQLLASGQHECLQHSKSATNTRQSTPSQSATPSQAPASPVKSAGTQSWHYATQGYGQQQYSPQAYSSPSFPQPQQQYTAQQVPVQQPQF
ncbi:hypothetical protein BGW80DRAFT_1487964 [Lactifluus volemus]|nr:hypothetical protein BGW80DRAFT_1487964 [Lactifluus volemus]